MQERYTHILERWFISEPPLFQVLCIHELVQNTQMSCPLRSGRKKLEYHPDIVREMSDEALEEALRAEAVRLLLKHPYERRPDGCSQKSMGLASNLVVGDNYKHPRLRMETPQDMGLKTGMSYEWYARMVEQQNSSGGGNGQDDNDEGSQSDALSDKYRDLAELWDEDELTVQMINEVINTTKSWGSLGGNFAELLQASVRAKINWRNIFAGFRASIISSKRKLTRMRPNRRTGFENMGSVRRFDTKLLVAVDVSGSISTESLKYFYGVINSAFRYGFESIDVIQFDCGVRAVHSLKKVIRDVTIIGRGGTSFQEPIDYAHENGYDGLVVLTDGYAPEPIIPSGFKTGILWVCENESCLNHHKKWMEKSGRTCVMQIV
jgi:predicted metal-dependent peptidase